MTSTFDDIGVNGIEADEQLAFKLVIRSSEDFESEEGDVQGRGFLSTQTAFGPAAFLEMVVDLTTKLEHLFEENGDWTFDDVESGNIEELMNFSWEVEKTYVIIIKVSFMDRTMAQMQDV